MSARGEMQQVLFEQRVLMFVTLFTTLATFALFAAVGTDYWVLLIANDENGLKLNTTHINFLWSHSGLWRKCDIYSEESERLFGCVSQSQFY